MRRARACFRELWVIPSYEWCHCSSFRDTANMEWKLWEILYLILAVLFFFQLLFCALQLYRIIHYGHKKVGDCLISCVLYSLWSAPFTASVCHSGRLEFYLIKVAFHRRRIKATSSSCPSVKLHCVFSSWLPINGHGSRLSFQYCFGR
jgi:hypothetical protein